MASGSGWRVSGIGFASLLVVGALVPTGASTATAATSVTRYAGPDGSGSACTAKAPCDIVHAVNDAPAGADVVVLPGKYGSAVAPVADEIVTAQAITIHGLANKPAPVITSSADAVMSLTNASADHLHLVQVGSGEGLLLGAAAADQMFVEGGNPAACEVDGGTVSNSVCTTTGAVALWTAASSNSVASVLRNVTAVGTGTGTKGVECRVLSNGGQCSMQLVNTIADGGPAGPGYYSSVVTGSTATFTAFNSSIQSGSGDGGGSTTVNFDNSNINAPPTYVNDDKLNFHEAHDSPTIDAGLNGGAQKSGDVDGLPRVLGKTVDIGAYEFAPKPAVSKVTITKRGKHALHLAATVLTQKLPALIRPVARHGHTSIKGKRKILNGSGHAKIVTLVVKHLKPHTKYAVKVTGVTLGGSAANSTSGRTR